MDGLNTTNNSNANANVWQSVPVEKGFVISPVDSSAGPVIHYFEVTIMALHSYKE
jgi:hypothetical protein